MGKFTFRKVTTVSSTAVCARSTNNDDLFVTNIAYTDLAGSNYRNGIIINDEILVYDQSTFYRGNCSIGEVSKVNLNTGSVTYSTYTVTVNGISVAGEPVYYDGMHLWLKPRCGSGDILVSTTTTTTKPYNSDALGNIFGSALSYAEVNGVESLYWFTDGEVYSYNINTAVKSSLNLRDQLSGVRNVMTVYNKKLLWDNWSSLIIYDLTTKKLSTLVSSSWGSIGSELQCLNCGSSFFASSGSKLIYATRPENTFTGIRTGLTFITLNSSHPNKLPETSATITTPTTLYNRASGYYYSLSPSGSFSSYYGIFRSDIAIDCKTGYYSRVNDFHILLGGDYTYFAKASAPNTLTIGSSKYDIIPVSELPRCLSPTKSKLLSFNDLHTNNNDNYHQFAYSSKKSNTIILWGGYSGSTVYNVASNTLNPLTLTPPQAPSAQPNGQYYYPVSITTEFDYWLYSDYSDSGKCKLVSSTDSTNVITLPGNTNKYYYYK